MKLRDYQKKDMKELKKILKKKDHVLFGAATGYGKSSIIFNLVRREIRKGGRVLVIAPRRKLIKQLSETLSSFGPSIIMGSDSTYYEECGLYIASTATLHRRLQKHGKQYLGDISLIIIDESHLNFGSASMGHVTKLYWNKAKWVGLSATPINARGYRLEGWDHTVYNNQSQDLIKLGWLTPVKVMVEDIPQGLDDLSLVAGDYNESELSDFMSESSRVSNVYDVYEKYGDGRKVMIFAVSINHADMIHADFLKHGVDAEVVHSNIDEDVEEESLIKFKHGEVNVIINVGKLTTGYDEPSVDCLILARPTKSVRLFLQIIGRSIRPNANKTEALILDIAGNIEENGYPTMKRDFNMVQPQPREKQETSFIEIECFICEYKTQFKNCKREVTETKKYTETNWLCPNCDEVLKSVVVDHKEVKRLKELENYSDVSDVTGDNVNDLIMSIMKHKSYKAGWRSFIIRDWKRNNEIKEGLKLIYNKWNLKMITIDTALNNVNKLRKQYEET